MNLFYRPKHYTSYFLALWNNIRVAFVFIIEETIWYLLWWCKLIYSIFQNLYKLGELILECGVKFIDFYDELWDEIEKKVKREENVLV